MRPPTDTRVPEILANLDTLLRQALPDVQVIYGPTYDQDLADDVLWIAPGSEQVEGMRVTYLKQRGLNHAYVEEVRVILNVLSSRGDGDMKDRVAFMKTVLAAIRGVLEQKPTLNDACDEATLGEEMFWHPVQHDNGTSVGVGLEIIAKTNV